VNRCLKGNDYISMVLNIRNKFKVCNDCHMIREHEIISFLNCKEILRDLWGGHGKNVFFDMLIFRVSISMVIIASFGVIVIAIKLLRFV